jgi:drug/metabolite transporter (DMT)-like permease
MYAGPRLGAVQTSVFIFTVPFIAISTANVILGEPITFNLIIGGLLAIISVYIVNFKS